MTKTTPASMRDYFSPLHHKIAAALGYKQTPNYASWDKVELTAPVQEVDRVATLFKSELTALVEELEKQKLQEWTTVTSGQTVQDKDAHNFNVGIDQSVNLFKQRMDMK